MARSTWTEHDISDLAGRRVIVTGASSGIGLEASRLLAAAGAEVVLAVRDPERGRRAADEIGRTVPSARLEVAKIDLSERASVRRFAGRETQADRGRDVPSTTPGRAADRATTLPTAARFRW